MKQYIFRGSILIILIIITIFYLITREDLHEDDMIKYSRNAKLYDSELDILSFNQYKQKTDYILVIPKSTNGIDLTKADKIIKITDDIQIEKILSLFNEDSKKEFNESAVIDLTIEHPVVLVKTTQKHYFRIDILGDYYQINQDNVSMTDKYYICDDNLVMKLLKIIEL